MAGVHAWHRLVSSGSFSLSSSAGHFVKTKNNLRYSHLERTITNWGKATGCRKIDSRFALGGYPSPILHGSESVGCIWINQVSCRKKYTYPKISPEDDKLVIRSPYSDVEIPEVNLADYVWKNVDEYPENVALVCGLTDRQYTFEMARNMSKQFGSALKRLGAKKGDCIAIVLPNIPEFPIAFLGAVGAGLTVATMNPTFTPEELSKQFEICDAKYVLTIGLFLGNIKDAAKTSGGVERIIALGMEETPEDVLSFIEMIITDDGSMYDIDRDCNPYEDVAAMPFSSGTTGPPKGVALTHYNLVGNLQQMIHPEVSTNWYVDDHSQECGLAILPFFHIFGMTFLMNLCLRLGVKMVTLPKFEPDTFITALEVHKPSYTALVPPLVSFISNHPMVKSSHLSSFKFVVGGAASFGTAMIEKFREKGKPHSFIFKEGFGLTETSPLVIAQPTHNQVDGACGFLAPNTIAKIVDIETGKTLGPNQEGELLLAGPQIMKGYHKNQTATKKTIVDGGWLCTGDLAKCDENGLFFIVDRLKELIKVKGFQVSPSELEDVIRRHPGVVDVGVIGVPDDRAGELPRAYIVRKSRNVLEHSIVEFVEERVAPHKRLGAGVMFVETLPKNQTGKLLRRELKSQVFQGSFGY